MKYCGVYKIENAINGKVYIGSAVDLWNRLQLHRWYLLRNRHPSKHMQAAWNLYGPNVFWFGVIELVEDSRLLIEREQAAIERFGSNDPERGYNIRRIARNNLGVKYSAESRARISEATKRDHARPDSYHKSAVHRMRISEAQKGRTRTPEHRAKLAAAFSPEYREALSRRLTGRTLDDSTKARISAALRGRPKTETTRQRMSLAQTKRMATPEARAAISKVHAGKIIGAEQRRKQSEAMRGRVSPLRGRTFGPHSEEWKRQHSEQLKGKPNAALRKFTSEQIEAMRSLQTGGMTLRDIAGRFDTNAPRVYKLIKSGYVGDMPIVEKENDEKA
jgi:group I intron endonuclease